MTGAVTALTKLNFDDSLVSEAVPALSGAGRVPGDARATWLDRFAWEIYGVMPPAPDGITVERFPIAGETAERIAITLAVADRQFRVDAALWLPAGHDGKPLPIALGLDFLGPVGTFFGDGYPIDPHARISRSSGGRLSESHRGITGYRWPIKQINDAGYAVLTSCYGSWVPDSETEWQGVGVWPLTRPNADQPQPGAIALWAWSISRLIDVAEQLPEIDANRVIAAGHSRLGKAVLLAAASDTRIGAVLVNNSGCLGASLSSRNLGETPAEMLARFPHWTSPNPAPAGAAPLDQHHLLASVAPRRLYVASASEDHWCDPKGEYLALAGAAPMWQQTMPLLQEAWHEDAECRAGPIGWHLRPGPHDIRPYDWARFLRFVA